MVKKFKQLVWLGAGNASVPKGLIDQAETTLLVEAREDAYQNLIGIFSNTNNVVVKQGVISSEGGDVTFYQYNLPEFSALHKATGLTQLFPGLKLEQQGTVTSQSIAELLSEVQVTGEDNVLVIDIVDISLNLLQQLHAEHLLHCFGRILLISSHEALYQDASKGDELTKFMQNHGFYLASEDKTDPDLPWHTFVSNPLWKELKQAAQHEAELNQQLDAQRQQLAEQVKQTAQHEAELNQQLDAQRQQSAEQVKQAAQHEAELNQQLDAQRQQLAKQAKQAAQHETELNKQLDAQRQQLAEQAKQAEQHEAELNKQLDAQCQQLAEQAKQAAQREAELNKQLDIQHKKLVEQNQQAEQLKKELSLVTDSNKNLYEQISAATVGGEKKQAELKDCLEQLDTTNKKLVSLIENAKRQEDDFILLQKRTELLEKQLERANEDNSLLRSQQLTNSSLFELERSIKELFSQQMLQVQHAANALGQHVTKTQIEQQNSLKSFLGLQHFLQHGERQLDIGEWSIQADTLNCLIKLLERNSYDLVIEFGSGDSTLVIAKTLMNQSNSLHDIVENGRLELAKTKNLEQTQTVHYAHDLPARVISFEQSKEYLNKTKQALNEHGVAGFVELILAPLVPVEPSCNYDNGHTHLFYDCLTKLKKLADILSERQSNILVIVDGPQSPEQDAFVRYAALPSVINVFSAHKLHIVLDDSKRDGEQQVITKWLDLLTQRGLLYKVYNWSTAKGATLIEVNP